MDKIKANLRQIIETIVLFVGCRLISAYIIRNLGLLKKSLQQNVSSTDDILLSFLMDSGDIVIVIGSFIFILIAIRLFNHNYVMNQGNYYHDYPFLWYWYCGNILGIKKCSLILVPIYMQFKLVIRDVFKGFPLNESEYPVLDNEPECKVYEHNLNDEINELNIILEDTYLIECSQIPDKKQNLPTIKISRNDGRSNERHFSQEFIKTIIDEIKKFSCIKRVNLYATTNPMNSLNIARRVFKTGNRGNIEHLYVYQQDNAGNRYFKPDGHEIY